MSKREERLLQLVELVDKSTNLHVKDAAQYLNVSEMTIRRDINDSNGFPLCLLGGYIIRNQDSNQFSNYLVLEQQQRHIDEKSHIGRLAANLVKTNDIVFFDCGTTIPYIIENIPEHLKFTAVCYSLNVFLTLQKHKNCKVILCGGQFELNNAIFTPIIESSPLDIICPSKSFISAAGISAKGITCFNLNEVNWKIKAMRKSNLNILVADNSKFDKLKAAYFGKLSDFDILISNCISDKYLTYCQQNGIETYQ